MDVRINTHGNPVPEVHGDWVDLCTAEDARLEFLEYSVISLGISVEIPEGYYAHVVPRSSTFGKWGVILANSMGVIDGDYRGDGDIWRFPALCLRHGGTVIPKGTRICQFRLVEKAPEIQFVSVEALGNRDRGGLGSTGTTAVEHGGRTARIFGAKETWTKNSGEISVETPPPDDQQGPYRGFLMVKCEDCGEIRGFCAKKETFSSRCLCGCETVLEGLRPLFLHCKCGADFRYKTNLQDATVTVPCLNCGAPVDMELNGRATAYVTVGVRGNRR